MSLTMPAKVELEGRGTLVLAQADHLATGGEGAVFRRSGTVIKLYHDASTFTRSNLADKIRRLSRLDHPYVVVPQGLVSDERGRPIGYYMPYAPGEPLARAFGNDFRRRFSFDDPEATVLAGRMLEVVRYAHAQGAVMSDANELNWTVELARSRKPEPRAIDVDSWAIGPWRPKVVMPSIRDWHPGSSPNLSDYFAWAVVTFQLFTGIHPYKGTAAGYAAGDLERRMRDNASVFAPGVRLNHAVRDFGCIPPALLDWYRQTFQDGLRSAPPDVWGKPAAGTRRPAPVVTTPAGRNLNYRVLYDELADPAIRVFDCGVVLLRSGGLYDLESGRIIGRASSSDCEVVRTEDGWLVGGVSGGNVSVIAIASGGAVREHLGLPVSGHGLVRSGNRLFLTNGRGLTELQAMRFARTILTAGKTWTCMDQATRWFDGLGIEDALGATYLIVPYGDEACAQIRVKELDGLRPVSARAGNRYAIVTVMDAAGRLKQATITFDKAYRTAKVGLAIVDSADINAALLPRGVVATVPKDGELEITVPASGATTRVRERTVTTADTLYAWGERVVAVRKGRVIAMSLSS